MMSEFYVFSKRHNSTAVPDGGTEIDVNLKDACSILRPVIELQTRPPSSWNYCFLPDFGRYYYVGDWTYERRVWTAQLTVDLLASWRSSILATDALVVFSSSAYNLQAIDNRIAATASYERQTAMADFIGLRGGAQLTPQGHFGLTVLSGTSVWATGGATTYFCTYQEMQLFAHELLEPTMWESLKQFFNNPMDGIIDCYYLPIDVSQYVDLTTPQAISVGDHTFSATGRLAQATNLAVKSKHTTIDIPWRYSDFRRLSPYSEVTLFVPYCGSKTLSAELLSDIEAILIDYSVDVNTGAVQALTYVKQEVLEEFSGNMKIQLPIGQSQSRVDSIVGAVGGAVTAIGGFSSGNVALGATGVLSAIGSVITPQGQKTCGGMQGSILGAILGNDVNRWQEFRLAVTSRTTTAEPEGIRAVQGNVLNDVRELSTLTGYVQTSGAHVQAPAYDSELQQIDALLDAGIYIE